MSAKQYKLTSALCAVAAAVCFWFAYYSSASGQSRSVAAPVMMGTKFTTSGCSVSTTAGAPTTGWVMIGTNNCSLVITMGGGLTAPTGWVCAASDRTNPPTVIGQSSSTNTTATLSVPVGAGTTDVISFLCMGY